MRTGSSPGSPRLEADALRARDLLERFDRQVRRQPRGDRVEHADGVIRVTDAGWVGIVWSELAAADADAVIAREVGRFAGIGPWEWKLYSYDAPGDLAGRLQAAGFEARDEETLLAAELRDLRLDASLPDGVELRDVTDERGVEAFLRVHAEAFGSPPDTDGRWLLDTVRAGRQAAVVAMAGDRPISAGRVEFYPGTDFAGLYGGGTVPDWRRRGLFAAAVARRASLAAERGFACLQVDAVAASRPILERMGFVSLASTTPFVHP